MLVYLLSVIDDQNYESDFIRLYNTYNDKVRNYISGILKDYYDSEETLLNTWEYIAKNISKLYTDDEIKIKNYIYTLAQHKCIDTIRKKSRNKETVNIDSLYNLSDDEIIVEQLEIKEEYDFLVNKILSLSKTYRDVLSLYFINELSAAEISDALNLPIETVKTKIKRGKLELYKTLEESKAYE